MLKDIRVLIFVFVSDIQALFRNSALYENWCDEKSKYVRPLKSR